MTALELGGLPPGEGTLELQQFGVQYPNGQVLWAPLEADHVADLHGTRQGQAYLNSTMVTGHQVGRFNIHPDADENTEPASAGIPFNWPGLAVHYDKLLQSFAAEPQPLVRITRPVWVMVGLDRPYVAPVAVEL